MRWASTSAALLGHLGLVAATLNLSDLQPASGFSDTCLAAYNTPIPECPSASNFISPSGPPCTQACFLALISAGAAIQNACQYQAARSGTVIGEAFAGSLGFWLCNGENTGSGNAASSMTASIVMTPGPSAVSSTSMISRPGLHSVTTTSSYTTSTQSSSSSSSTSSASFSNVSKTISTGSTTSSITIHSTSISTQSSSSHSHTTSSTSHSSTKSISTAVKPSSTPNDSTPFDQSLLTSGATKTSLLSSTMTLVLISSLTILGSIWVLN